MNTPLILMALMVIAVSAQAQDEQTWNHYGVVVTQHDVALKEAHDTCEMHPVKTQMVDGKAVPIPSPFWPEPCGQAEHEYAQSGSKAKFDEIERRDTQSQVDSVKGALTR